MVQSYGQTKINMDKQNIKCWFYHKMLDLNTIYTLNQIFWKQTKNIEHYIENL